MSEGPNVSRRLFRFPWRSRRQIGADVDEELRFHLDMRIDELVRAGMTPAAARSEAMREFGDVEDARRYITAVDREIEASHRRTEYMSDLRQDLAYALRKLRATPAFTLTVILTLALGIGANTAIFSVVNSVLLKPLPFPEPDRVLWMRFVLDGSPDAGSPPELADFRSQSRTMESLAMYEGVGANLARDDGDPELLVGMQVSANWFNIFRATPSLGRTFVDGDDREGAPKVAVLNERAWRRYFNADPRVVGRAVRINGEQVTVVGVVPAGSVYPAGADLWLPLAFTAGDLVEGRRSARWLSMMGRLKPEATLEQAEREMSRIASGIASRHPRFYQTFNVIPTTLHDRIVRDLERPLLVIMGAVAFVLLIACANVANLFLVRATGREGEMAIRTALGAGRSRLVRQLVTESVVLSLVGAACGLVLAKWGMGMLLRFAPPELPRVSEARIDGMTLLVTLLVALATGVVFGLLPATQSHGDLGVALRAGGRGTRARQASSRARRTIVIAEVALAVTLLVGAGLLLRSFQQLLAVDPGFRPEGALTFRVRLPQTSYPTEDAVRQFVNGLDQRLTAIPGVRVAGMSNALPLDGSDLTLTFHVRGTPVLPDNQQPSAQIILATPGFFPAMGMTASRGRLFSREDRLGAPQVVMVNREFARRSFPNEDPIGKYIDLGWTVDGVRRGGIVVGIVGDVKQVALERDPPPSVYLPVDQVSPYSLRIVLRTSVPPASVTSAVRAAVREMDRQLPVFAVRPLREYVDEAMGPQRFYALMVAIFAVVALSLAAIGLYGVIAYAVSQRTHELGVRVALGASGQHIHRMVVAQGLVLTLLGVIVGIGGALATGRLIASLLFGVGTADPLTLSVVALLLLMVAVLASYLPARRAARVDPLIAMRG